MRVIVTRFIVSTISLYFTRHKIIIRIKSNVFCICVYNGRYYRLPHIPLVKRTIILSRLWITIHFLKGLCMTSMIKLVKNKWRSLQTRTLLGSHDSPRSMFSGGPGILPQITLTVFAKLNCVERYFVIIAQGVVATQKWCNSSSLFAYPTCISFIFYWAEVGLQRGTSQTDQPILLL